MNLNNLSVLEHQQLSASTGYHSVSSGNSNSSNNPVQMKSFQNISGSLNSPDKVIFKIESDHLNNGSSNASFRASNYTYQVNSGNAHDTNGNNLNMREARPLKMYGSVNSNSLSTHQLNQQQVTPVKQIVKVESVVGKAMELKKRPVEVSVADGLEASNSNPDITDPNALSIYVNNVVCSYSTRCHLNLRRIAMEGMNVEYKKENGMVNMKLRKPYTTATMWSSGKVTCAGAKSEQDAYKAARRFCRMLQKMLFKVKMTNYRVVNVLATCNMPFGVDIQKLAENYQKECSYEPELHPGATFKLPKIKATLKLFTTGSITLTAPTVLVAQEAINQIYPILLEFKRTFPSEQAQAINGQSALKTETSSPPNIFAQNFNPTVVKHEPGLKIPVQSSFSNINFGPQPSIKSITKIVGTQNITQVNPLSSNIMSNQTMSDHSKPTHISHINSLNASTFSSSKPQIMPTSATIQKPNNLIPSASNHSYQVNVPHTYHQLIQSNSMHSYSSPSSANSLFIPSITSTSNSSILHTNQSASITHQAVTNHHDLNLIKNEPVANTHAIHTSPQGMSNSMSIISSNSFSTNLGSLSQPNNGWYYDSLLVDNVDDFLP